MDLAKLVVRLETQSAQLLKDLDKANGRLASFERSTNAQLQRIEKRFKSFGSSIKGVFAILAGAITFREIVSASADAAKNFALLENSVAQAGAAAGGRTAQQFADVSKELQNISIFSDDAIQNVQQLLLRFQNIRTDKFDTATKSVLNLASALGLDLDSAAKLVGKALSDPEKGMGALAKAGVVLSDSQKKVIKDLTEAGKVAEAQGVLLDQLEKKFGGAAEAARNNFSGALAGVKNSLNDLMEVDSGLPGATASLNELSKTLQDPAVKAGADALFSVIIRGAAAAAALIGKIAAGLAVLAGAGGNAQVDLDNQIQFLEKVLKSQKGNQGGLFGASPKDIAETTAQLKAATDQYAKLREQAEKLALVGVAGYAGQQPAGSTTPLKKLEEDATAAGEAAEKLQKKLEAAGDALTNRLQSPQEKYDAAVAEADKLLAAHVITLETWARALGAARGELDQVSAKMLEVSERFQTLDEQIAAGALSDIDEQLSRDLEDMGREIGDLDVGLKKVDKELGVFAKQAAKNTQDILADGITSALHDGFSKGAKGALEAFGNMLEQMAIQAIAANIAGKIFGENGEGGGILDKAREKIGGKGDGGGFLGTILGGLGTIFGGSRDNGGRGRAGEAVMIGKGAQPEMYVPDTAGEFFPKGSFGGNMSVTQNISVSGPLTQRTARQLQVESGKGQRIALARLG